MSKVGCLGQNTNSTPLSSKAWLSKGIESFYARLHTAQINNNEDSQIFDILIIGSGYGGAIAAHELSTLKNSGLRIAVLERGREFLPGSFPNNASEAPTEIRTSSADGRKPKGNLEGLFDIRLGSDLNVVQANGLGGGSLINAGVMARANETVFNSSKWPQAINSQSLEKYYSETEELLGAVNRDGDTRTANTILLHPNFSAGLGPQKYESLKRLAQADGNSKQTNHYFKSTNITVNMQASQLSSAGIKLNACNLCGDCASGCNNNAKISLDKNLLAGAMQRGVEIFTGVTVNSLEKKESESSSVWHVKTVYTDASLRSRQQHRSHIIKAKNVILAAGSLGSTEILKRSQTQDLTFSKMLGKQFSSNGDMTVVGYDQKQPANAISYANIKHSERDIGPTITGMIDLREHPNTDRQMVIQEMAVPAAISHFFSELYATTASIRNIWNRDSSAHSDGSDFADPAAINPRTLKNTSLYAVMGDDDAAGELNFKHSDSQNNEGTLQVQWSELKRHHLFDNQFNTISSLSKDNKFGLGGMVIPNPFWQLLKPASMELLNLKKGPPLSVHPLGGCPMGESVETGVCNYRGQLFAPNTEGFHQGLFVLDGAIIPQAVGINPALTISAVCLKAIRELINDDVFKKDKTAKEHISSPNSKTTDLSKTPIIRSIEQLEIESVKPTKNTEITITERLVGATQLENDDGAMVDAVLEISLWSKPLTLANLSEHQPHLRAQKTKLFIDSKKTNVLSGHASSKIRIYLYDDWLALRSEEVSVDVHEILLDEKAQFVGRLTGHIDLLGRAESYPLSRFIESAYAWTLNRGIRDIHQYRKPLKWEIKGQKTSSKNPIKRLILFKNRLLGMLNSFSQAGEIRTLRYQLSVDHTYKSTDFSYFLSSESHTQSHSIIGSKRLSYIRRSNPWLQLSKVHLEKRPNSPKRQQLLIKKDDKNRLGIHRLFIHSHVQYRQKKESKQLKKWGNTLALDLNYLAKINAPLFEISQQENQVQALLDLSSFAAYVTRILVGIHFYSFRAPETPAPRKADRQALKSSGLPAPNITSILVDVIPDDSVASLKKGDDVNIVLTHYAHSNPIKPPVMMIHGYSASSTTFAHESLPDSLAKFCFAQGRDVWLIDLRTSCALNSARYPWSFERVAATDIPSAVSHVYDFYNGQHTIDVICHCMGSVMLGMSILKFSDHPSTSKFKTTESDDDASFFKKRLNKIVFSQATPALKFTPDNNFRSFATSYLKELVPDDYQFQPQSGQASSVLDRVLYTLPYPAKEYDILNAPFTPSKRANYARTRHRIDAFFTRTFELNNVSAATLDCIDDFFGPIHINTIIQASQFAKNNVIADRKGRNEYLSRERLQRYWGRIPTMSFHCKNNGLIDFSTGARTQRIFQEAGVPYRSVLIENEAYGHQDSIISPNAHIDIFPHISDFLDGDVDELFDSKQDTNNVGNKASNRPQSNLIIEPPSCGPLIIEATHQELHKSDTVRISFGTNEARAGEPHLVVLPVKHNDDQFDLVCDADQSAKALINHYLKLTKQATISTSKWWKIIELPKSLFNNTEADGLAVFLIYDDLIHLCPNTIQTEDQQSTPLISRSISHSQCSIDDINLALESLFKNNHCYVQPFSQGLIEWHVPQGAELCFALGSCQYPGGIFDKRVAYHSYESLNKRLQSKHPKQPLFLTLLGDQIYADATAGLLDPSTRFDQYSRPYLHLYQQPQVRSILRKLPTFNMLDDHELIDNWEPVTNSLDNSKQLETIRESGVRAFLKYQRAEERPQKYDFREESLWYQFSKQQHDFFMCDTRTKRSARTAENVASSTTTIIDEKQHSALEQWLNTPTKMSTKFVLSSSILLPRHSVSHGSGNQLASAIRVDSWDGYPSSLHRLLAYLVDNQKHNIVFLSGDDHIACFAEIKVSNQDTQQHINTWSAHCPGLYTPFPFANARVDDFEGGFGSNVDSDLSIKTSEFEFQLNDVNYHCQVNARFGHSEKQKIELGPINIETLGGFLLISTR